MKKAFLLLWLCGIAAGCAQTEEHHAVEQPVVGEPQTPVVAPEKTQAVVRSGRKDPLLKGDYVLSVLGQPELRRYEKPSEVWLYPKKGCVLFVFMQEQDDETLLVRHMEIGTPTFQAKYKDSIPCLEEAAKLR